MENKCWMCNCELDEDEVQHCTHCERQMMAEISETFNRCSDGVVHYDLGDVEVEVSGSHSFRHKAKFLIAAAMRGIEKKDVE